MANDPRKLGHQIAASLIKRVWKKPRPFWHDIFHHWTEHVREYMDLWEIVEVLHTSSTSYTIPDKDAFVLVDTIPLAGPYNVFLPSSPFEGQYIVVKDEGGAAAVGNEIIVNRNGRLIDGASTNDSIDAGYGNQVYLYSGTQWLRLAEGVGGGGGGGGGTGTAPTVEVFDITGSGDKTHTVAGTPAGGGIRVALNGVGLREGGSYDYTVSGDTVTITANQGVQAGDWLEVVYYT